MKIEAANLKEYISKVPEDRIEPMTKLADTINANLAEGFEQTMQYNMPSRVIPHSIYPAGYHCKPSDPLPFLSIASQKNFIAVYHMGLYVDEDIMKWFLSEFPKHSSRKLDMGKSCIRFKKMDDIPYELIGELVSKMTVKDWIELYESKLKR